MYQLGDTIAAISSPSGSSRIIIRISGLQASFALSGLLKSRKEIPKSGITKTRIQIDSQLRVDAKVYFFRSPHSYTGEDVAEIHFYTSQMVSEKLMERLFKAGARQAGPGEFTARSFFNGKMDLSQAEAVNQIITGSNGLQIDSAQKLLSGRLSQITQNVKNELLDCLSLLEAGMDFSTEDIEFLSLQQAAQRLRKTKKQLDDLLNGAISYEIATALPSVGIAGAPNAGKSRLFNSLLGKKRSIVYSGARKTTRDVVTCELTAGGSRCVLFDCAGLIKKPCGIIDKLVQAAAIEGLNNSNLIIFCVDVSKPAETLEEDMQVGNLIKKDPVLAVATKADFLSSGQLSKKLETIGKIFNTDFLSTSAKTGLGIETLKKKIEEKILEAMFGVEGERKSLRQLVNGLFLQAGTGRNLAKPLALSVRQQLP